MTTCYDFPSDAMLWIKEVEMVGSLGAVVKSRKGLIGVEGGKNTCYQWKEKGQRSQGDRCSFRQKAQDRAQKPEHTAATPSEPTVSRDRSVSRKRRSKAKVTMGPLFDNCADVI